MSLAPGTRLGPYEIVSPLGSGGMGEVYRARDTRLGREAAVKVLPAHLSSSPQVRARFDREAKAISSLSHPHICTLYDVGREGDVEFLVMELIEGETLAQRLLRGPLPPPDVLRLGTQIASALDRAHRAGVVHRDLKPGNVMLTKTGAKLMDFGLAKGMAPTSSPALTMAPTATSPLTAVGAIVGTFQYMSPEQLEGEEADARSDLFALGLVLYEMATGRRAFEGRTQASLIAAILKEEPKPIRSINALSPSALERLVGQCLRKDPDDRVQSAHDVALRLEEIGEAGAAAGAVTSGAPTGEATRPAASRARERVGWILAALATAAAAAAVTLLLRHRENPTPLFISSLPPGDGVSFDLRTSGIALSPDGGRIAYIATGAGSVSLWVRPLASDTATRLVAAEDVNCVSWSPDGRWLTYLSQGRLMKVEVESGQAESLASVRDCLGISWGTDGWIYFVSNRYLPVTKIAASGGAPIPIPIHGRETAHRMYTHPSLLPDGRHILYTASQETNGEDSGVFVATTDGREEKRVLPVLTNAQYVEPGWLVYSRQGSLRAQAFDSASLEVRGDSLPLAQGVQYLSFSEGYLFALSRNGVLVYIRGNGLPQRQFTWLDRQGNILGTVGKPGNVYSPRLSHDGKRLAYDMSEVANDNGDIWVHDLERDIPTRLTFDPRNESAPIWSPDDRRLLFFANFPGRSDLFTVPSDGTGSAEPLFRNDGENVPTDWSNDGTSVLVQTSAAGTAGTDLLIYSTGDKKVAPWIASSFDEKRGRFSPDRRWLSYDSDESGRMEVYVRGFAGEGKWRVSSEGGHSSAWRRDGKELFYVSPDGRLMSVPVTPGPEFRGGTPVALFRVPTLFNFDEVSQYDVSPDGQRFLMNLEQPTQGGLAMTLVTNWTALLKPR